jgi:SpoIIAA-like
MTVKYSFLEKWKLVLVRISESVTYEQMTEYLKSLSIDPRYQPPMNKLVDFRECGNYTLTREEAEKFAILNRELDHVFANEKCAIVAPGDLEYGMSRVHEMYTSGSGMEISVFRRLRDALEWLGIDPDVFE